MTDRPTSSFTSDALRDPHIDGLWRAGSTEEPPPAIDAALLALARREAGAKPHDVRVAEATRPERWWWPLAAAAVIGVVVVGMLPILSTETVDPFVETKPLDRDDAARRAQNKPQSEAVGSRIAAQTEATNAVEPNAAAKTSALTPTQGAEPGTRAVTPQRKSPTESPDHNVAADSMKRDGFRAPAAFPPAASGAPAASDALEKKRKDEAPRESGAERAVPFPASPAPTPDVPPSVAQAPSALGGVAAPQSPSPPAAPQMRSETRVKENETTPPMRAAAMPAGSADDKRQALAAKTRQRDQEGGRALEADVDPAVAEWIARIRRLRDEGKPEEARKEWAALREKHPDAEQALPPELREWLIGKR